MEVNNKDTNPCSESDPPTEPPKKRHTVEQSDITLLPKEITLLGVLPSTENKNFVSAKGIAPKTKKSKSNNGDNNNDDDESSKKKMIGRPISGVVDGVFDAGYLMSVRIGGSDAIYRGVVFGPGLVIPPSVPGFRRPESGGSDSGDGDANGN